MKMQPYSYFARALRRRVEHWPDWPTGRHRPPGRRGGHRLHWEHRAHGPNCGGLTLTRETVGSECIERAAT